MDIITTYPLWFTVFCVLLGGLYAFVLYRYDPRTAHFPVGLRRGLGILRALLVLILAFLLLKPLLRTQVVEVEEPIVAFAQDVSSSVPIGGDSAYYVDEFPERTRSMLDELRKEYEVRTFSFADELSDSMMTGYSGKRTDIARALEGIRERFRDRNLGAVVLATDGIYNSGADPRYFADLFDAPIHPIALGDTTVRKDLIVKELVHNRYAYQGNRFPIEIAVRGRKAEGGSSVLTIRHEGEERYRKELNFEREDELIVERTTLEADSSGLQRYTVELSPVEGEVSKKNNVREFFIEVLESKRKVLALAHAPHPDIRALKGAIEKKNSYEVRTELAGSFEGDLDDKDLLLLHQLPSKEHGMKDLIRRAGERDLSILFVLGNATSLDELDPLLPDLSIQGRSGRTDEAAPVLNDGFGLFDLGDVGQRIKDWPPLTVPFGEWKKGKGLNTLFRKKVGQVSTEDPIWAFMEDGRQKIGVVTGEGLWRWRLRDMAENGNTEAFQRTVEKTVQYLSVREDKSRFRVEGEKEYREDESIIFTAELYDRSYELMNDPDVEMLIRDQEGKAYPFSFSRTSQGYRLDAGSLPVGEYSYEASVEVDGDSLSETGRFRVTPVDIERSRTVADHGLLYDLARRSGGQVHYPDGMGAVRDSIEASGKAKAVRYTQQRMSDLISWKWLFLPLLLLMSLEWFIRKRQGAY